MAPARTFHAKLASSSTILDVYLPTVRAIMLMKQIVKYVFLASSKRGGSVSLKVATGMILARNALTVLLAIPWGSSTDNIFASWPIPQSVPVVSTSSTKTASGSTACSVSCVRGSLGILASDGSLTRVRSHRVARPAWSAPSFSEVASGSTAFFLSLLLQARTVSSTCLTVLRHLCRGQGLTAPGPSDERTVTPESAFSNAKEGGTWSAVLGPGQYRTREDGLQSYPIRRCTGLPWFLRSYYLVVLVKTRSSQERCKLYELYSASSPRQQLLTIKSCLLLYKREGAPHSWKQPIRK